MTDIILEDIQSGYDLSKIRTNFQRLEQVINEEILHTTGGNNVLQQDVDVNSKSLYNIPPATQSGQAVSFGQVNELVTSLGRDFTGTAFEAQFAGAGQVLFNLNNLTYSPGGNNLAIYVELDHAGIAAGGRLFPTAYTEVDSTTIELNQALPQDTPILFVVNSDPVTGDAGTGGVTEDSQLVTNIINNIALGNIFTQTESFTIDVTMAYGYTRIDSASLANINVPSGDNLPAGVELHFRLVGEGAAVVVPAVGVTINPPSGGTLELGGQGATVTLKKAGLDEWDLIGQVYAAGT